MYVNNYNGPVPGLIERWNKSIQEAGLGNEPPASGGEPNRIEYMRYEIGKPPESVWVEVVE